MQAASVKLFVSLKQQQPLLAAAAPGISQAMLQCVFNSGVLGGTPASITM
jgi:hypothetical protein